MTTNDTTSATKAQLQARLRELGIAFRSKAPRPELLALLAEAASKQAKGPAQQEADGQQAAADIAAAPAPAVNAKVKARLEKRLAAKPSAKVTRPPMKQVIWELFNANPELVITLQELIDKHLSGAKESSVLTWVGAGGLGSKKYGFAPDGKKIVPMTLKYDRATGKISRVH